MYAVVRWIFIPRCSATAVQSSEVNWEPRSLVMSPGVPKRATQQPMNARATSAAVVEDKGIASGHLVALSTIVRRKV